MQDLDHQLKDLGFDKEKRKMDPLSTSFSLGIAIKFYGHKLVSHPLVMLGKLLTLDQRIKWDYGRSIASLLRLKFVSSAR